MTDEIIEMLWHTQDARAYRSRVQLFDALEAKTAALPLQAKLVALQTVHVGGDDPEAQTVTAPLECKPAVIDQVVESARGDADASGSASLQRAADIVAPSPAGDHEGNKKYASVDTDVEAPHKTHPSPPEPASQQEKTPVAAAAPTCLHDDTETPAAKPGQRNAVEKKKSALQQRPPRIIISNTQFSMSGREIDIL